MSDILSSFELPFGKPVVLQFNVPVKYRVECINGSLIEGLSTPNHPVTITNKGDIKGVNMIVDDESFKTIQQVSPLNKTAGTDIDK